VLLPSLLDATMKWIIGKKAIATTNRNAPSAVIRMWLTLATKAN
jgi:hypothetical protein